jgi:trehalose 6-phosphate synthase/phosphatase
MELSVHPELKQPLIQLCSDPNTTVVVLSGSGRTLLDEVILYTLLPSLQITWSISNFPLLQNFREYNTWLAAENGMFLNSSNGEWMTTMPEQLNMEWVDSVKVLI